MSLGGETRFVGKSSPLAILSSRSSTGCGGGGGSAVTLMTTLPGTPSVVAVISEEPAARPVTRPVGDTDATAPSADDHSKVRPSTTVFWSSRAVATSCTVPPTWMVGWGEVTVTEVTGFGSTFPPPSSPPHPETQPMTSSETANRSMVYLSTGAPFQGAARGNPGHTYLLDNEAGWDGREEPAFCDRSSAYCLEPHIRHICKGRRIPEVRRT